MFNKKRLVAILTGTLLVGSLVGCSAGGASNSGSGSSDSSKITISGSTSVGPTMEILAEDYQKANKGTTIEVQQVGSSAGITNTIDGTSQIGMSSRDLKDEEKSELKEYQIAIDGIAVITNSANKVKDLTLQQVKDIYTGKITNWKEVGGPDEDIVLVTRPGSSGTRATFQKYALDGNEEASNASMETDDSGVLLTNVKDTKGAIGYVALSYLTGDAGVETVAIDGVEPTLENTYSGEYPVWTFEHMYTKGEPNEVVSAFLDYITGDKYGSQMEKLGYGVSSKMTKTEH